MENNRRLRDVYYNPSAVGSFGGAKALAKAVDVNFKETKRWLSNQFAYSLHKLARR